MRKILFPLFLFSFFPRQGICQQKIQDFAEVTVAELQMKSCLFEPEAAAMVLKDVETTDFDISPYGSKSKIEKRVRIKIFNEKGYKHASIKVPYYSKRGGMGKIKELSGVVYNLDETGKIVIQRLDKDDFFKEKAAKNIGLLTFTFPGVKPGSIIEYSYTRIERDITSFDPWVIQGEIPVAHTVSVIITPVASTLKEKLYGTDTVEKKIDLIRSQQFRRTVFYKENIPSFRYEPFMSSAKDNLIRMVFFHFPYRSFFTDILLNSSAIWKNTGSRMLTDGPFAEQMEKKVPGTETLLDSAKKINNTRDRIKFLYGAVKERIPEREDQARHPDDITEAWNSRSGSTAEINMILLNLLLKADVTAYPLLVSTRSNGKVKKDFPSFGQLNGLDVVAVVDSSLYYVLDASIKFQPVNIPPLNILNREALLLRKENVDWFIVEDNRPLLKQNITLFCDIDSAGIVMGQANIQHYGYAKAFALDTTDDQAENEKFWDNKVQGVKVISVKKDSITNDDDPLTEVIEFSYEPLNSDNFFFINPQFLTPQRKNPFTAKERRTDIDMGCNQEHIVTISLMLPENYEADNLPKNILVRAPDSSFYFKRLISVNGNIISYSQIFEMQKSVFYKEDYPGLLDFFTRIYALMNEEIIIRRKK